MRNRLLIPREHGAWVMLLLPFLVGAISSGNWLNWRVLAAGLAALSLFLLRASLPVMLRTGLHPASSPKAEFEGGDARLHQAYFSTAIYGMVAALSALALLAALPAWPLLGISAAPILFLAATLHPWLQRHYFALWFELASVALLTSSALLGNFAAAGELRAEALWIWLLFSAEMATSILAVRAQLGFSVWERKGASQPGALSSLRVPVVAEALLWTGLVGLSLQGDRWRWLPLAFLLPSVWHGWLVWRLAAGRSRIPPRWLGLGELGAAAIFSLLLLLHF